MHRRNFLKPSLSQALTFVLVCVALLLLANLGQKWVLLRSVMGERQVLARTVAEQRAQRDSLARRLEATGSDAYAEQVVREEFGWVRGDEGSALLQFVGEGTPAQGPEPAADAPAGGAAPHWLDWCKAFLLP